MIKKETVADLTEELILKEMGEWLQRHCLGYHKGNHGGQFGHFGIYRSDIEKLLKGEMPE